MAKMVPLLQLTALALVLLAPAALGVTFDVRPNQQRCLVEEVRRGVPFHGEYSVVDVNEGGDPAAAAARAARFPRQFLVRISEDLTDKELYKNEGTTGKFHFIPENDGPISLCFTDSFRGGWRMHASRSVSLTIRHGITTNDYAEIARKEQLYPLALELRRLEDEVWSVREEMIYQKKREEELRDTNEETNARAAWLPVFALIVLFSSSAWQIAYLKAFFRKKKLI